MHFHILRYILFTIFAKCFDRYSGHLQGCVFITRVHLRLIVSPSIHNKENYMIYGKVIYVI